MSAQTYTKTGTKATVAAKLPKDIFSVSTQNHDLLKQAYLAYLANGRINAAKVKTRGDVRGGGRKPWRQKGTGRARFGSSRNPIWRGGGITFGPTGNENYKHHLLLTQKRQAIRQALTLAAKDKIKVIESFDCKEGTTKSADKLLQKLDATRNALVVVPKKDSLIDRSTRNIPYVKVVSARYLNVYDLLNADHVIIAKDALTIINEWLGTSTATKDKA